MASVGIDRETGALLRGWPHVVQSLGVLFTTRFGQRVMRRHFGSEVPSLLGENLTPATILRFMTAIVATIDLWEPRFRIVKIDIAPANTPERLRTGRLSLAVRGEYRPRAHLGDLTPERGEHVLWVGAGADGVLVTP